MDFPNPFAKNERLAIIAREVRKFAKGEIDPYVRALTHPPTKDAIQRVAADLRALGIHKADAEPSTQELSTYLKELLVAVPDERFPADLVSRAGEMGYLGAAIPEAYGGAGYTLEELLPILEGIGAADGSLALTIAGHSLATTHILLAGSEEQKRAYLPDLASGKKIGSWCLTEPGAGSAIFRFMRVAMNHTADGWILRGEKTFITNASYAETFVVIARALDDCGKQLGISACLIDKVRHLDRIEVTPLHHKMGMRASNTATVCFKDVPIASEELLGAPGSAGDMVRLTLLRGRVSIGAIALGLARDSFERAVAYSKERRVGAGKLSEQQLTQVKLADMAIRIWTAWQVVFAATRLADEGKPFGNEACMAKLTATEAALSVCNDAIQILGGNGYMGEYKIERNYRDARLLTIGEGTSEILRLSIAKDLLDR